MVPTENGRKEYPPSHCLPATGPMRPLGPKARVHALAEYCDDGRIRECRYAFSGEIKRDADDDKREVHCFRASLSEHDLDRLAGASGRPIPIVSKPWHLRVLRRL